MGLHLPGKLVTNTKAQLAARVAVLERALAVLVPLMIEHIDSLGGCDHSVGIWCCGDMRAVYDAQVALGIPTTYYPSEEDE